MGNALVKDSKQAFSNIRDFLVSKQRAISNLAPKYLDTERMIRVALGASSRNPKLLQCSPKSWLMALMDCALYGLEPNPQLGHAYLVPFRNNKLPGKPLEVTFIPGYKGLILLATETAGFDDVEARIVYSNELAADRFYETPEDPLKPFHHRPLYADRGDVAGAYAVGWRGPNMRPRFAFLPVDELEARRKRSRAKNEGPWVTDTEAMYKKTAVKAMLALAALKPGSNLGAALEQDSALERGEIVRARDWSVDDDPQAAREPSRIDALADSLDEQAAAEQEPEFDA